MKNTFLLVMLMLFAGAMPLCVAQEKRINIDTRPVFIPFEEKQQQPLSNGNYMPWAKNDPLTTGFRYAAGRAAPAIVHLMVTYKPGFRGQPLDPYTKFYHDDLWPNANRAATRSREGSASGVLLSSDGYIVTNYHVVRNASAIEIMLADQQCFAATIVGTDSLTDLALLKIPGRDLPFVMFGNTDSVATGDWVLAIGNPFSLTGTVTAGIISAKDREINTVEEQGGLYSFIQTDAVMNDGNSGGALVDVNGRLVGVNTGIVTPTGVYTGYAFSIPVEIVKKVSNDLLRYGKAQRGYMGVYLRNQPTDRGLFVDSLVRTGVAARAGILPNDGIIAIDGQPMNSAARFNTLLLLHRPGDTLKLTLVRNGKLIQTKVILDDQETLSKRLSRDHDDLLQLLGMQIITLPDNEKRKLRVTGGVKVTKVRNGKIYRSTNIEPGFIIMFLNGQPVDDRKSFLDALEAYKGEVILGGIYADYPMAPYYYNFML